MTADAGAFAVTSSVDVHEGERRVFARTWTSHVPRDLV
jgi:hypothetical protein